ncbi:LexA repressor [bioreactor metagenome]|uniref:LexA repressor n=1 Tax=bioreactor metagenome TaxID=1076179 RepID=A0A644YCX9_9ZZZZ
MTFGSRLKDLRIEHGMTQAELAAMLRVTAPHISNLEADKSNPSDMLINSLCISWHIEEHWLRTGEGSKESRADRIREYVNEEPDLRHRLLQMEFREKQLEQLRYLFAPTYPRIWDMLKLLSEVTALDFVARLNLLIKDWDEGDVKNRARIEVRMEDMIVDFPSKITAYQRYIKKRSDDGAVVPFSAITATEAEGEQTRVTLPVMGRAAAGEPKGMIELSGEELLARNDQDHIIQPGDFIVIADGDSMIDCGIHDGDYCVIHQTPEVENGQIALIAVGDGSTIKRLYKEETGFRLVACNAAYPDQHYPPDADVRVLGHFIKAIQPEA